jgi:hypothetical protein
MHDLSKTRLELSKTIERDVETYADFCCIALIEPSFLPDRHLDKQHNSLRRHTRGAISKRRSLGPPAEPLCELQAQGRCASRCRRDCCNTRQYAPPRLRYVIGRDARIVLMLKHFLPAGILEWMLIKFTGIDA